MTFNRFIGNPKLFVGSLKPMCLRCSRRVYGIARGDGWWCANCDDWIVKPRRECKAMIRKPERTTP